MIYFRRLLPYLSSGLMILFFELFLQYYKQWVWWLLLIIATAVLTILFLNSWRIDKDSFGFLVSPIWLLFGAMCFIFFQEKTLLQQLTIFSTTLAYWLFVYNIGIFFWRSNSYISYTLENIAAYINLLAAFFIYVSAFSFYTLSVVPLWVVMLFAVLATLCLSWQALWINKVNVIESRVFPYIVTLMIGEIFWVMHYWPASFLVSGLVLTIIFYIFLSLIKFHYAESLNKKVATRYIIGSGFIIILILATAQWT